jgi:hypothetical protein
LSTKLAMTPTPNLLGQNTMLPLLNEGDLRAAGWVPASELAALRSEYMDVANWLLSCGWYLPQFVRSRIAKLGPKDSSPPPGAPGAAKPREAAGACEVAPDSPGGGAGFKPEECPECLHYCTICGWAGAAGSCPNCNGDRGLREFYVPFSRAEAAESERDQLREQLELAQAKQRSAELGLQEFQRSAEVVADRWHVASAKVEALEEQLKATEAEVAALHELESYVRLAFEDHTEDRPLVYMVHVSSAQRALARLDELRRAEPPAEQAGAPYCDTDDGVTCSVCQRDMHAAATGDPHCPGPPEQADATEPRIETSPFPQVAKRSAEAYARATEPEQVAQQPAKLPDCPHGVGLCTSSCPRQVALNEQKAKLPGGDGPDYVTRDGLVQALEGIYARGVFLSGRELAYELAAALKGEK